MSCSPELQEKPQIGKVNSAWCSSLPLPLSPWKKSCGRAPSAFYSCTNDLIKISPPSLNLLLPVFLDHQGSSTVPTHCTPSPKGRDNVPNHLQHHLHIHCLCLDFRPHVPAANPALKPRKSLKLWAAVTFLLSGTQALLLREVLAQANLHFKDKRQ